MVYRVAGITELSENALQAALVQFEVNGKNWSCEIKASATYPYTEDWKQQLQTAVDLPLVPFFQLHKSYGELLAATLLAFIEAHELQYQVQLIACPGKQLPAPVDFSLGDGGTVAALTGINTVSHFTDIDTALGGSNQSLSFPQLPAAGSPSEQAIVNTCFFAVLRWREENNFLSEQTGASRNSIGGAVWIGQEW